MAIGEFMCAVVDVNDVAVGEQFWSAVTGWPITLSGWNDQYSEVGTDESSLLLQLVSETKTIKNRVHLDFRVKDVAKAIEEVIEMGGVLVRPPGFAPRLDPEEPMLEWAIVADPFGNEFCVIKVPQHPMP